MGKKKRIKRVALSQEAPLVSMDAQADDQGGPSSFQAESPAYAGHTATEFELTGYLDELDEQISTDEHSCDARSILTDLEVDEGLERIEVGGRDAMDAASLYAPRHVPAFSTHRRFLSPFDDGATVNSNQSIAPLDVEYTWENGRRYCGSYYMPNDKLEQTRLLLVHEVYKSAFNYEPTTVPLDNPTQILDVGVGTGEWAIDMADRYDDCEVTGIDIADIFPRFVAPNLFWEIDNAELEWLRPTDSYDLVHFRNMAGAFSDWPFIYQQAFRVTKPGGWIELLDFDDHRGFRNFLSFFESGSVIHQVAHDLQEASVESGRPRGVGHLQSNLLFDAGFVDVLVTEHDIPISPKEMTTGHLFLKSLIEGMEATILRLLTTYKGWSAEQVRMACDMMSHEFKEMALDEERCKGFVVTVKTLTGRKPEDTSWSETEPTFDNEEMMEVDNHVPEDDVAVFHGGTPTNNDSMEAAALPNDVGYRPVLNLSSRAYNRTE
ncbi:S-adenosyl-L-methionine-dependent methyltransferase [Xylariales sp. AK1849]|nr:S-adenosyl-L-methionine-dependent methyltransferase [Xylariales sp. AK1849]